MENRVYFITDAHLCGDSASREREAELCRLLDRVKEEAATLVLLGDIFDFWFTYRHVVPRGYVRLLGKLAELSDQGISIHYFVGNHDMWLFDYLEKEIGITMHDEPTEMSFGGRRFLIGHGDGLGHLDRHYDLLRWVFRNRFNQWLFSTLPEWTTFGVATRWSSNSKKHHKKEDLQYLGDEREGIVLYCKEKMTEHDIDFCVFGHRHTPVERELTVQRADGTTTHSHYVNVGDWLIHRNYAVFSDGQLSLHDNSVKS